MEKKEVTIMVMIDLSAAFDTVDHDILLDVLQKRFGVEGKVLQFFDSYLRPRSLKTIVNEAQSTARDLNFSVPQGSCAGPVLYNFYASTLEDLCKNSTQSVLGYADDHTFYDSFSSENEANVVNKMQSKIDEVKTWMTSNRLKMNDSKTETIYFGTESSLKKVNSTDVKVGNDLIKPSPAVKYLGAWLDSALSMKTFIKEKCKIAHFNIHNIRAIRKFIDIDVCKTLMHSLVLSHLDYSNALLVGLPNCEIEKLQSIQTLAAKTVLKMSKYDSKTEALYRLHWLPISYRIKFKLLCFVYKALNNAAPVFLQELLKYRRTEYNTRAEDNLQLEVPLVKGAASRSFGVEGPRLWNTLPIEIRMATSFQIFKKKLKTYFFKEAFADQISAENK